MFTAARLHTSFLSKYVIFSFNSADLILAYGSPTTITHLPKSSLKFSPSLNLPPNNKNFIVNKLESGYPHPQH